MISSFSQIKLSIKWEMPLAIKEEFYSERLLLFYPKCLLYQPTMQTRYILSAVSEISTKSFLLLQCGLYPWRGDSCFWGSTRLHAFIKENPRPESRKVSLYRTACYKNFTLPISRNFWSLIFFRFGTHNSNNSLNSLAYFRKRGFYFWKDRTPAWL